MLNNLDIETQVENIKCDLCGSDEFTLLFFGNDYLFFSPLKLELKECKNCGLVGLNPRPKDISPFYREYHNNKHTNDLFEFLSPSRKKKIEKFKKPGKILDIGCGQGGFLNTMKSNGWETYGVELSKDACHYARTTYGLKKIYNCDLLSFDIPENYFDVVTLWHVFEHLSKPQDTLKRISKILKEDGLLLIESPNFHSMQSKIFKNKWFSLDLPRHLYQFSPKILKKYLENAEFKIVKSDYIVNPRINFISFKNSLLRWLGIQKLPGLEFNKKSNSSVGSNSNKIYHKFLRFLFDIACLTISLLLNLLKLDDSFRLYCKKY